MHNSLHVFVTTDKQVGIIYTKQFIHTFVTKSPSEKAYLYKAGMLLKTIQISKKRTKMNNFRNITG
jgi:hypothetical protein